MSVPLESVKAAVAREWARFGSMLDAAPWSAPTRLSGWTVRDLVVHTVWGITMEADAVRSRDTATGHRADGRTVGDDAGIEVVVAEFDRGRTELVSELDRLTDDDLASVAPLPYADLPVAVFSQILVMEAGVHASDLSAALGHDDGLAPDVVVATEFFVRAFLPMLAGGATDMPEAGTDVELRGPTVALRFRFDENGWAAADPAAAQPAPHGTLEGDDTAVLLFAMGRIPPTDARLSVVGDARIAERFKSWLPGP